MVFIENLYVIAGLGNPGLRYEYTRHNVGFNAVDYLAARCGIKISRLKFKALSGEGTLEGAKILLVKPQTFMNASGESLREIVEWYRLPPERLIVVYDDADLPLGKIRVRPNGSSGTHNGMRSIIYQLQTDRFPRIKIGIGKAPEGWDMADYVLGKFSEEERKIVNDSITRAADAASMTVASGVTAAMNKYNGL